MHRPLRGQQPWDVVRAGWIEDGEAHDHAAHGTIAGAAPGWEVLLQGDHVRRMGRSTSICVLPEVAMVDSSGFLTSAC